MESRIGAGSIEDEDEEIGTLRLRAVGLALALFALGLGACGESEAADAVGTYRMDFDAMLPAIKESWAGEAADKKDVWIELAGAMCRRRTLELAKDASFVMRARVELFGQIQDSNVRGNWRLEGSKLTLVETEHDGRKSDGEVQTMSLDGSVLKGDDEIQGRPVTIIFKKVE